MDNTAKDMPKHDDIDEAFKVFTEIVSEVDNISRSKWSEADTRLKVIDRVLFDVLGWSRNDAGVEERAGSGFTDYTLRKRGSARVIVEAKKDSVSFDLSGRQSGRAYKLNGPVFNAASRAAIDQAIVYSAFKNCELACATNGAEWIVFRANRLGDGQDTLDGKGFIFSSLAEIRGNFRLFYDLLSENSGEALRYRGEFQQAEGVPVRDLSFLKAPRASTSKRLLPRGDFSADFDAIMASFFERLKGDKDEEMILKCFVVTPESQLADEKLLRVAEGLVSKIRGVDTRTGHELIELLEAAKIQHKNRFILLVGNKGAGKSTFVDRFFKFVIPTNTAKEIVVVRIDLSLHAGGNQDVVAWLNQRLLEELEAAIFGADGPAWDEIVGKMFFDDYQRWANATMSHLYATDKNAFKIEFGRHVEKIRENQPHEYIKRMVGYITRSNHKIPCLVFDNTDHFTIQFQESVFQYARSIYESEFCVVLLPITDKTSWQLSKQGALQSFESEALFLPVPRADRVIERRIAYLMEKLQDGDPEYQKSYFLSRGIRLRLDDIAGFAGSLNKIFVESSQNARWIGGLANHDIRRVLELTKDTIASPHLKLDDLLKAHIAGRVEVVPEYRIKMAVIKRRYDIYPIGEHSFVQNVFAFHFDPPTTPLLGSRILQFLRDADGRSAGDERSFVAVEHIQEHLAGLGVHPQVTMQWLGTLLQTGLVFNYDPTVMELDENSLVEASPSGNIHLLWSTLDVEYLQMMKDVTPVRDKAVYEQLVGDYSDYKNRWRKSIRTFIEYLLAEDAIWCAVPGHSSFAGQLSVTKRLSRIAKGLRLDQAAVDSENRKGVASSRQQPNKSQ
ncbi:AAA family ATPase [Burkholderia multivorans]|uniref:AAA family ATPase n=2 Tax=Burkholderia multivorans TaxID=87883 RepID=UPI0021C1D8F8|nr:AAA family ATPase [Burkholderia multivorans]MCO8626212.1 AAA family ATPase [Burkholderia multivorans]